jgi:plasmid maintenance system antidote protein VapI
MPMKNPPHPGEVIREEVLAPFGLGIQQAAEILGVRRAKGARRARPLRRFRGGR